jgi:hypothetical protein
MIKHCSAGLVGVAALLFTDFAAAQCATEITRFDYSGTVQVYAVPYDGTFWIEAAGAEGSNNTSSTIAPGKGAYMGGKFSLNSGTQLNILAGQQRTATSGNGGGGGSFVTLDDNSPLVVAGGGGGSAQGTDSPDKDGQIGTTGGMGAAGGGAGGSAGSGGGVGASGFQSGAGGGLLTNGADGWTGGTGGAAFVNGGSGGTSNAPANGGFGGGGSGSSYVVGGGGGGYSGGGSGGNSVAGVGGGGGSFNSGTNQDNQTGVNSGSGYVRVCSVLMVAPTSLPDAAVDAPYYQTITASGGTSPYTFAVVPVGSLPPGLTLFSDTGVLSGTPTTAGTYPFTVQVTDAVNGTATQSYSVFVQKAGTMTSLSSACQNEFVENQPFTLVANVSGTPTGTVDFFNGATNVCPGVAIVSGSASCTVNDLAVQGGDTASTLTLTAAYNGDDNYTASISPDFDVIVLSAADVVFRGGFEAESIDCPIE